MANLKFSSDLAECDPLDTSVIIIGQKNFLTELNFSDIKRKLAPRVSEQTYRLVVSNLRPFGAESLSLYLNVATVACLPESCSRHNTPSHAHSITKLIKNCSSGNDEYIVIVCEYKNVFSLACAVARAFPVFSRKTKFSASANSNNYVTVTVEFVVVNKDGIKVNPLSNSDIAYMTAEAQEIRLAGRIVDTPCNDMHTDTFIQNKNNKKRNAHSGYIITPLTISVSSSEDEPRLKRKLVKVSNDSSENEKRKRRKDHQVKKKPEKNHLSDKRRIPKQPEFVIDRNGGHSSSFAQDFHHCEDRSKYRNSAIAMNSDFKYKDGIDIEGVLYTYAPLLFDTGIFQAEDCTGLSNFELSDTTDEPDGNYERKNPWNESTSSQDDRNYRSDHVPDKKYKHYNKHQHNRYDGSSESSRKLQHQRDKNKKYFSSDTKHHNKHQSNSSSTDSEYMNDKWNKPRSSNTEASALWHSERLNEDKNKRDRCIKWVEDSVHECNLEKERIPADEEEKANTSPKRKLEKFETTSDKCLNDNDVPSVCFSSRNKPKQSCNLKSRKLDCTDNKSSTKVAQKTQVLRKSHTKFDRINHSDHSSDDSDSNCNLESNKQDYTENDNSNLEKEHFKCNMKYENEPSEEKSPEETSPEENEEPSNSERKFIESKSESKSSSYNPGCQFVKRSSDNQRYSPVRKVYSHNDGYVISREFTYSDRGCNEKDFKKGSKAKRNPQTNLQYNSPESCKNEHISKKRKFDKGQSKEALNNQRCKWNRQYFVSSGNKNRSMKAEKCTSDKKRSDFNVVQSLNQDDGGWSNIVQSQVEDEDGWDNTARSQVDDDDGIWASADQFDIKGGINEDCNTKQKSAKKSAGGHDKKEAKAFKGNYERKNPWNESTSSQDDRNYRSDHVPDKKYKHYNKHQHYRYDGSSESSRKLQHQRDKNKKYFSSDTKHHNKHQSNSSSTDSEYMNDKWNKPRSSNTEASALWHSERLNEDKNKRDRCIKWVEDSVHECNLEKERIPADEEEKANTSPKRKLEKFETTSDKCLNDNDVPSVSSSSKNKPKQSCNLKSRKLDCTDNKSSTKVAQKTQVLRKSYTKFDRSNRSDHSSDDSDSNCNLESNKQDYTENDNSNLEKEHFKCNMKLENEPSEEKSPEETSPEENEEPSNSERKFTESKSESKSSSYNPESQFVKRSSDNQRYSPVRKVYSHNDGYVISREFSYSDRGCNEKDFKKGSKAKRNPQTNLQYNSPESFKNEHISKQRKFDKGQSKEALNNQRCKWNRQYFVSSGNKNRSMKAEKCTSDKKRSDFNVVQSLNQDDGGWSNIVQSQVEDEDGWDNTAHSQVDDDDDGIWASADQSDIKGGINEHCNTKQKSAKKNSAGHDKKEAKAFKVKHPIGSDDGGWSTVEEGEMRSDDGFEENKEHVK